MDIERLIKQALNGTAPSQVANVFFGAEKRSAEETRKFITALLQEKRYETLAEIMSSVCIDRESDFGYVPNKKAVGKLTDSYFRNFMELVNTSGVDPSLVYPMLFAAFDAPKNSYLYSFVGGIDEYLTRLSFENYDNAVQIIGSYDKKLKCLSTLYSVDRHRTVELIISSLIHGKHLDKTAMRKYLLQKRVDIVPELCDRYVGAKAKEKESIVRMLLLYKGDVRSRMFLQQLLAEETSVTVRRLIEKDMKSAAREKQTDKGDAIPKLPVKVKVDGKTFTLTPNVDLTVTVQPEAHKKEVTEAKNALQKRLRDTANECETAMCKGTRIPAADFEKRIKDDAVFAFIASNLLFTVYKGTFMSDIVTVENGEIRDLENKPRTLEDEEVAVSHTVEWEYHAFLRTMDVPQPFEQIRRAFYVASDTEKTYNFCSRVSGRLVPPAKFKAALGKYGFKLLNKNRYDESACAGKTVDGIVCVIEFEPTDFRKATRPMAMDKIRFYRYGDLIKLGGQTYTEGVAPYPIREMSPIMFSEFMRDVFAVLGA